MLSLSSARMFVPLLFVLVAHSARAQAQTCEGLFVVHVDSLRQPLDPAAYDILPDDPIYFSEAEVMNRRRIRENVEERFGRIDDIADLFSGLDPRMVLRRFDAVGDHYNYGFVIGEGGKLRVVPLSYRVESTADVLVTLAGGERVVAAGFFEIDADRFLRVTTLAKTRIRTDSFNQFIASTFSMQSGREVYSVDRRPVREDSFLLGH